MGLNRKDNKFHIDSFYHQLRMNCSEFGIHHSIIDRYIGQVEDIKARNKWELLEGEYEDA